MNHLEILLSWLTLAVEIVLCGFVFARRANRALPFFTAYATVLLVNTIAVWLVYVAFGISSLISYYCYWISVLLNAVMRSLAIAELCSYKLRGYRGIWGLVWRGLAGVSILFLLHAGLDTWGQPSRLEIYSLTLDRDLDIASIAILAAVLLVHNYYGLALESLQRMIATGICLVCSADVIVNTTVRSLFTGYLFPFFTSSRTPLWFALKPNFERINDFWSTIHLIFFMAAMGIWCYALRKPLPAPSGSPVLLPAEVYREMSPAINMRLSTFNDRMMEMLKP